MPASTFEPNAYCAAVRCNCKNGSTALPNTLEYSCGNLAFCSSIALNVRSNSSFAVLEHHVVLAVVVVRLIVRLTIAGPAGVGIVRADVMWMRIDIDRLAGRSNNAAFRTVTSSA